MLRTFLTFLGIVAAVGGGVYAGEESANPGGRHVTTLAQDLQSQIGQVADAGIRQLLERFYGLPDLLTIAKQNTPSGGDVYAEQTRLSKEYESKGQPYRLSMPYRHPAQCKSAQHRVGAVKYTLVDPRRKLNVELWEVDVHEAMVHGAALPESVQVFLRGLP